MSQVTMEAKKYEPAPFQIEDLSKLEVKPHTANFSQMGCYKSSTALWLIERRTASIDNPRVLIITTKSGKGTYFQITPYVLPDWNVFNVSSRKSFLRKFEREFPYELPVEDNKKPMLVVAHYDVFSPRKPKIKKDEDGNIIVPKSLFEVSMHEILSGIKWDMLVLDEAHRIKNKDAKWTKFIKRFSKTVPDRHIMTGTGFINRPDEIWSLFNFLDPKTYSAYWSFRNEYCEQVNISGYNKVVGVMPGKKDEFRKLVRDFGPRRMMTEVFPNIPEPIYTPIDVELNAIQRKMYDSIKKELRALDQAGVPIHATNVLAGLQRLRQVCVATPQVVKDYFDEKEQRRIQQIELVEPSSKLDAVMELIEGLEWDDEFKDQVVIFSNFRDPLELLKVRLDKKSIPYLHMKQADSDQDRYYKWAELWPKKEHQVFLTTLQLGSESISLTSAQRAVFLDRSWSPKDNRQAESRIWRPGQEGVAQIIHINAMKTTDQRVEKTNIIKENWFNQIFGEDEV